ncbi:MAG: 6-pyruvoyl trahydropterin synthase family protein [Chloroflexota bacterium]
MFEVGVARTFHALHQLEAEDPAAGHEHSHDYRAEVVARGEQLDQNAMLVDIDALGAALAACLAELDAADLGTLAAFEGQATTVETVAEHVWKHVRDLLAPPPGLLGLRVTVFESLDAWASVDRPVEDPV